MTSRELNGEVLIAYAKQRDDLRHISEVARGLECNCACVECGEPLVAKKGAHREPHFSHLHQSECHGGVETVLHRLAKELFTEMKLVAFPEYRMVRKELFGFSPLEYNEVVCPEGGMTFSDVEVESHLGTIIPDLILSNGADRLIVEIAVSHRVDAVKLARLKERNIPVLEIRLSARDAALSKFELADKLANDLASKQWLFHPAEREHEKKCRAAMEEAHRRINAERTAQAHTAPAPRASRLPPGKMTSVTTDVDPYTWNRLAENFNRQHGRYPNLEETLMLHKRLSR